MSKRATPPVWGSGANAVVRPRPSVKTKQTVPPISAINRALGPRAAPTFMPPIPTSVLPTPKTADQQIRELCAGVETSNLRGTESMNLEGGGRGNRRVGDDGR